MIKAESLVMECRRMIGVKFVHQGRSIYTGVDCIGLSLVAALFAGVDLEAVAGVKVPAVYSRAPQPILLELVEKSCRRISQLRPGAFLLFSMRKAKPPHHSAIYTDTGTMIHADGVTKHAVIEQTFGFPMKRFLHSVWALPGVEYPEDAS